MFDSASYRGGRYSGVRSHETESPSPLCPWPWPRSAARPPWLQYAPQYAPSTNYPSYQGDQGYDQAPPPDQGYNQNQQSYQDYQTALSTYNEQRDAAAREGQVYDQKRADYEANRRAYRHQLREYYEARDAYNAQYGPGAYEAYYGPAPAPY